MKLEEYRLDVEKQLVSEEAKSEQETIDKEKQWSRQECEEAERYLSSKDTEVRVKAEALMVCAVVSGARWMTPKIRDEMVQRVWEVVKSHIPDKRVREEIQDFIFLMTMLTRESGD